MNHIEVLMEHKYIGCGMPTENPSKNCTLHLLEESAPREPRKHQEKEDNCTASDYTYSSNLHVKVTRPLLLLQETTALQSAAGNSWEDTVEEAEATRKKDPPSFTSWTV